MKRKTLNVETSNIEGRITQGCGQRPRLQVFLSLD